MASVKVAVRVRPFNQREIDMDAQLIIQMRGKTTGILNSKANARDESIRYKEFTFDHSYWSHNDKTDYYASQETVYKDLGTEVVDCAFEGYNACVFAYGQTGSGKTFTMMGSPDNQGLIPRICKALFDRMTENSKRGTTHRVQVSYLEIYQERVADLLLDKRQKDGGTLKVREHPKKGPYVQGLTTCWVTNYGHIQDCMARGNSHRTTASTNMNDVSSRSHAIFTITFVQASYCDGVPSETVSKIHLVDLAGSERADSTGATGQRLKEGAHINKSLVTLGSVISALAEISTLDPKEQNGQKKTHFIPYRDSVLTWLLKDSLGGNSKTIMIAAISPADCNYGETLSTLRYANRAKNIINKPTINEDSNVKLIRELRNEISKLKALMFCEQRSDMLAQQIHEKETREKELTEEWTGKWREAQAILREQTALGLRKSGAGVVLDSDRPHLVAIDDDPLSTGVTLYHLKEGTTTIGSGDSDTRQDIELRGAGMETEHCTITFINGTATLTPKPGAYVMLNNQMVECPAKLSQGCIIFLGKAHVFRFNDPAEAAELRKSEKAPNLSRLSLLSWSTPDLAVSMENLQSAEEDKSGIEIQKQTLEKEKEQFEKEQEQFEKNKEDFEKRKRRLEEAQAQLESEKRLVQKEHAEQTKQLHDDWRQLNNQQNEKELELRRKEQDLIMQRNQLEKDRLKMLGEINQDCDNLQQMRCDFLSKFTKMCNLVSSNANDIIFPDPQSKIMFQELTAKSQMTPLSDSESDSLVEILNNIRAPDVIQKLVNEHRKELAELQAELNRRVQALCDRQKSMEEIDQKLIGLVNDQESLSSEKTSSDSSHSDLQQLKNSLANRTNEELLNIEQKKLGLTLNLKRINSVEPSNNPLSADNDVNTTSLSSATYHTAPNSCGSPTLDGVPVVGSGVPVDPLMCDSGVELRPPSIGRCQDESCDDLSSNEGVISDSQSTSSIENRSPVTKKNRRRDAEALRRLSHRIAQVKNSIVRNLDGQVPKDHLDKQIANLQELQRQYMNLKYGCHSMLAPAPEHPLQDMDSPSPIKPLHSGSTSALYTSSLQIQNQSLPLYNQYMYRSMPSIAISDVNCESIINISGYHLRGAGTKTHYEYEVRIWTVDDRWTILRRYTRFRDLHIAMKARYKEKVAAISFPSKTLFANTEAVAQSRKRQLELYLQRLIETCKTLPSCPLAYGGPITKTTLLTFSPFFRKGVFENGKYGTS
ncbi:kinesin-like protein Klp98A [Anthonomus grandis grandis]|uniref:kinesin-like protein Klp98A n=1 Tax=Anthonomus grandis grandis TaxID=2921223 RepID=UPI0021653F89|nr:kinesin-like protein Klp98A [Anthonomus grandis grandis]